MLTRIHIWGTASGPARSLSPQVRLLTGIGLLVSTLLASSSDLLSVWIVVLGASSWAGTVGYTGKRLYAAMAYAVLIFGPLFLVIGLLSGFSLLLFWTLVGKSICALVVAFSTAASLDLAELHRALARLPVPGTAAAIIVQIAHQTGLMAEETGRVVTALRMRTGGRSMRIARPLVTTWLPRIFGRAERVAAVMEVRNFARHVPGFRFNRLHEADRAVLAFLVLYCIVLIMRY